jgi:hypothetical protein
VVSRRRRPTAWRPVKTSGYSGEEVLEELEEALLGVAHAHLPTSDEALAIFRIGREDLFQNAFSYRRLRLNESSLARNHRAKARITRR